MKLIDDPNARQEIIDAYFAYFHAYTARNWPAMVSRFAEGITMIGTGIDEFTVDEQSTLALFRREFAQSPTPMTFHVKRMEAFSVAPEVALVVILLDMSFHHAEGDPVFCLNNRTTAVMVRQQGAWRIAHAHWSQPDADLAEGESVPFRLLRERTTQLEELVAQRTAELRQSNAELTEALANVKRLRGILPICAHCKNIRHDAGYWTQIEQYITEYTDAFFSHSICPDCMQKHYPLPEQDSTDE